MPLDLGVPDLVIHDFDDIFLRNYTRGYQEMNTNENNQCIRNTYNMAVSFTVARGTGYNFPMERINNDVYTHQKLKDTDTTGAYDGEYDLECKIKTYLNLTCYYLTQKNIQDRDIHAVNESPFMYTY